ncbi:MAG: hypothetical protein DYG94_14455 [Leptolyngbya sp. PLA3]|nr:MAG: hypothetical protein EDM82_14710 [Cyanobacteria bacterium CYA]MCE7969930.1 hypothetical protein [Leptolyngbya sp. PL-A3]
MSKRSSKKTRSKPAKASKREHTGRVLAWVLPLGSVVAVGALGVGMTIGIDRLDQEARIILVSEAVEVDLNHPVTREGVQWLPSEQYNVLVQQARDALDRVDPFDVRALQRVSEVLGQTGWFREPPSVRRSGAHAIRIDAVWRIPAAVVRSGGRDHLISWDGTPMPMSFPIGASGAVTILGAGLAPADPAHMYTHPWPGTDVQAGLQLLRLIQKEDFKDQVAAIDVSGLSRNGGMVLVTREETRVVWGGVPGAFRPGEVNDDVKLERLRDIQRKYGRIDAGGEVLEVHSHMPLRLPLDTVP